MRIFVLLSRIPYPLEKGDKLRAFNQIKELSKNNEIILCALNSIRKADKQQAFAELQPYCRSVNFIDIPFRTRLINIIKACFTSVTGFFLYPDRRSVGRELLKSTVSIDKQNPGNLSGSSFHNIFVRRFLAGYQHLPRFGRFIF